MESGTMKPILLALAALVLPAVVNAQEGATKLVDGNCE